MSKRRLMSVTLQASRIRV